MKYFDFLFYLIYRFYSNAKEKGAASSSAGIVGGLQTANILTVFLLFRMQFDPEGKLSKLWVIVLFLIFQVTTYYRYIYKENHSVEVMEKRWLEKSEEARHLLSILLFLYVAVSVIGFIGLAIYIGSTR